MSAVLSRAPKLDRDLDDDQIAFMQAHREAWRSLYRRIMAPNHRWRGRYIGRHLTASQRADYKHCMACGLTSAEALVAIGARL